MADDRASSASSSPTTRCRGSSVASRAWPESRRSSSTTARRDGTVEVVRASLPRSSGSSSRRTSASAAGWNRGIARDERRLRPDPECGCLAGRRARSSGWSRSPKRRPDAAVLGPRLRNPDGTLQRSVRGFPDASGGSPPSTSSCASSPRARKRLNAFYAGGFDHDEEREVEWVMGACMLVRRRAIDEVGALDESFFLFSEETDWCYRFAQAGWKTVFTPAAECVHVGGASHGGRLFRENVRGHLRFLPKHRGSRDAERARRLLHVSLRLRGRLFRGERGRQYREAAAWLGSGDVADAARVDERRLPARAARVRDRRRARPGLAARAGARRASAAAALAWSLALVFVAGAVTFAAGTSLTLTLVLCSPSARQPCPSRSRRGRSTTRRISARYPAAGGSSPRARCLASLLWHVAGEVGGDGLFHLARVRKLEALRHALARRRRGVPGRRASPWLRVSALASRSSPSSPWSRASTAADVVLHEPSVLAPLVAARHLRGRLDALPAGRGRPRARRRQQWRLSPSPPDTAARIPRSRSRRRLRRQAARSRGARARLRDDSVTLPHAAWRRPLQPRFALGGRASDLRALPLDPVRRLPARPLGLDTTGPARGCAGAGCARRPGRGSSLPGCCRSSATRPRSDPTQTSVRERSRSTQASSSSIRPTASTSRRRCSDARGPSRSRRCCWCRWRGSPPRRRWAAYVVGGSLAVLAVMLVSALFTPFADAVSLSQARRAAGFLPFAFAFAGGAAVITALLGPLAAPLGACGRDRLPARVPRRLRLRAHGRRAGRRRRGSRSAAASPRSLSGSCNGRRASGPAGSSQRPSCSRSPSTGA